MSVQSIQSLPSYLQATVQQNLLEREFQKALNAKLAYRKIAKVESFPVHIGETLTKTRAGWIAPGSLTALNPATDIESQQSAAEFAIEQFTVKMNDYGKYTKVDLFQSETAVVNQLFHKMTAMGKNAAQYRERLARNAIFDAYMSGNTHVTATLGTPGNTVAVDDIRGFQTTFVAGVPTPISTTNTKSVSFDTGAGAGLTSYVLQGFAADVTNTSSMAAVGGISGTLTFTTNVSVAMGTLGNSVISADAAPILRPNSKTNTAQLDISDGLTFAQLRKAVSLLRDNAVEPAKDGFYYAFCDSATIEKLYSDQDFKYYVMGTFEDKSGTLATQMIQTTFGCRLVFTTETIQQTIQPVGKSYNVKVKRIIVCGEDSLIESRYEGLDTYVQLNEQRISKVSSFDGIVMVIRPPLDALSRVLTVSWNWAGGYVAPTDVTSTADIIPTAYPSNYKRSIVIETALPA